VTAIAFMYNSRLQVCHAGNLLMRLNFPLYAGEYAAYTCSRMFRPYPMSLPSDLLVRCPPKPIGYSYRTRLLKGEYIADCVEVARLSRPRTLTRSSEIS
jgi:hypothetical protein